MSDDELSVFLKALPMYYNHLRTYEDSLIVRIYGVYKIQMEDIVPVNLLLMANTIKHQSKENILGIFDLKGSFVNRFQKVTADKKKRSTQTVKDINLLRKKKEL